MDFSKKELILFINSFELCCLLSLVKSVLKLHFCSTKLELIWVLLLAVFPKGSSGSVVERPRLLFRKRKNAAFCSVFWNSTGCWQGEFIVWGDFTLWFSMTKIIGCYSCRQIWTQCLLLSETEELLMFIRFLGTI